MDKTVSTEHSNSVTFEYLTLEEESDTNNNGIKLNGEENQCTTADSRVGDVLYSTDSTESDIKELDLDTTLTTPESIQCETKSAPKKPHISWSTSVPPDGLYQRNDSKKNHSLLNSILRQQLVTSMDLINKQQSRNRGQLNLALEQSKSTGSKSSSLVNRLLFWQKRETLSVEEKHILLVEAMKSCTPFARWDKPTIIAWLELWVGLPEKYMSGLQKVFADVGIGLSLVETKIQRKIGLRHPLHQLKLQLAVQEMITITTPGVSKPTHSCLAFGDMNHEWIGNEWLPSIGLPQYSDAFIGCLVDARMLAHLTTQDLIYNLKMVNAFHRTSLQYGINCLKRLNYDRDVLEKRRQNSDHVNKDVIVWSNDRLIKWLDSIGLKEYSGNLKQSGIHGALIALDYNFKSSNMMLALQLPPPPLQARQILEKEFENLLLKGTDRRPGGVNNASTNSITMNPENKSKVMKKILTNYVVRNKLL